MNKTPKPPARRGRPRGPQFVSKNVKLTEPQITFAVAQDEDGGGISRGLRNIINAAMRQNEKDT